MKWKIVIVSLINDATLTTEHNVQDTELAEKLYNQYSKEESLYTALLRKNSKGLWRVDKKKG